MEWQRGDEGAEGAEYAETVVRGSRKNMRINNGRWGGGDGALNKRLRFPPIVIINYTLIVLLRM